LKHNNKYCAFFRVDANKKIGSGHFVRCRILAESLNNNGFRIFFVYTGLPEKYKSELLNKNFGVYEIPPLTDETDTLVEIINKQKCSSSILITDSDKENFYTSKFQLGIKNNNIKLMTITFRNDFHFYSDILHNQNIMAPELNYSAENYTVKLLGTEYVILDSRYSEIADQKIKWEEKKNIVLISFGGTDEADRTSKVYRVLQNFAGKIEKIIVVTGAMYENRALLENLISKSKILTEMYQNTDRMPYLMREAKYAFTSGGLTAWELGVTNTLNIIISSTPRENLSGKFIGKKGYGYYFGNAENVTENELKIGTARVFSDVEKNKKIVNLIASKINPRGTEKVVQKIIEIMEAAN